MFLKCSSQKRSACRASADVCCDPLRRAKSEKLDTGSSMGDAVSNRAE